MSIFLKTCCPLWHRILTNNFYTPCTTLPSSPQTHFNVSFIPSCILMELYTGELLFGTHENLEHLALMDGLFWFHSGWKVCAIETPSKPQHDRWWFQTFFLFSWYFMPIWGRFPFWWASTNQAENSLKHRQEASLGGFPSKMLSQATGQPRDKCPVLKIWRFRRERIGHRLTEKSEAYEIPVFWSLRLLWLLQKNLQSWVRYLARDRHGGWKLNWL